ncbi:acyloxyacyl hydrolase [Comamonas aquatica]|nr:acyloxyacyl hydrolase [Comamonas aquatica]
MQPKIYASLVLAICITSHAVYAQDLDARPTWYLQIAQGEESSHAAVLGTTLPWKNGPWSLGSGQVRGHWDIWLGGWSNKDLNNHRFTTAALGIGPSLRWRGAQGTSPWFVEAGTGIMATGKRLYNDGQRMGTRFNFASHVGGGMNFGHQRAHELSLRLQHASNAGIQNPNPGINFVQLRYAHAF